MNNEARSKYDAILYDLMFLVSFLLTIVSSLLVFVDIFFIVLTLASFCVWLGLTLAVLEKKGVPMKQSIVDGRLISGLPSNRQLHFLYTGTLLVSLMLFFGLMLVVKGMYVLFAFIVWLFVGSLVMQELGSVTKAKKQDKRATS